MPPPDQPQWWYDCIPRVAIILKKSKDDPVPGGKHDKQWSGVLFRQQTNVKSVDLLAMLGGVHLSVEADLRMGEAPSLPLGDSWRFLLGKTAWPFLSGVCDQKTNAAAATYLNQIFEYMSRHGNPSLTDMTLPRPQF